MTADRTDLIDRAADTLRDAAPESGQTTATLSYNGRTVDFSPERVEAAPEPTGSQRLVYGSGPHLPARLPRAEQFRDSVGYLTDFCRAHDVEAIANALIAHWSELGHCRDLRIAYLWRRKKQAKNGKVVLGTCQKLSGIPKTFLEADWAITLNAENCRAAQLTRLQLEALTYHELSHIAPADDEEDPDAEPTLCGHDVEMFHSEIRRYGLWKSDLAATAEVFEQMRLFGDGR